MDDPRRVGSGQRVGDPLGDAGRAGRLERVRRELRAEIVPYAKGGAIVRNADLKRFTVPVQRQSGTQRPDPGAPRPSA